MILKDIKVSMNLCIIEILFAVVVRSDEIKFMPLVDSLTSAS